MHIQYTILPAPPGDVLTAESRDALVFVGLGPAALDQLTRFVKRWYPGAQIVPTITDSSRQVMEYLEGERKRFSLPLDLKGTDFQNQVWKALTEIPYGETSTYGRLAHKVDRPLAPRAVGQACGANPIPLVIPCHRVLTGGGGLGGFGSGLDWKRWLLALEQPGLSFANRKA